MKKGIIGDMSQNATVILVDDDKEVRMAAKNALDKFHHILLFDATNLRDAEFKLGLLNAGPDVALIDRSFFEEPTDSETSSKAGLFFAGAVSDRFPNTIIVFFSDYEEQDFGTVRFPGEKQYKSSGVIERGLGMFINSLPSAARR